MDHVASISLAWSGVILICLAYAALCDIAVRLIPNRLSLTIAALAMPMRLADHQLGPALLVAGSVFLVLTGGWMLRLLGGGDVKLWTACTLLVAPSWTDQLDLALGIMLLGGLLGLLYLGLRLAIRLKSATGGQGARDRSGSASTTGRGRAWIARIWRAEQWRARHGGSIPYGVAIAASAAFTLWPQVPR